jgi:hypothetical protein
MAHGNAACNQADEGLEQDRPAAPGTFLLPDVRLGPDPIADRVVVIASRPGLAPRVIRRAVRSRGPTGRRKQHTQPRPQVQSPWPPNEPPGPCRHAAGGETESTGAPA